MEQLVCVIEYIFLAIVLLTGFAAGCGLIIMFWQVVYTEIKDMMGR